MGEPSTGQCEIYFFRVLLVVKVVSLMSKIYLCVEIICLWLIQLGQWTNSVVFPFVFQLIYDPPSLEVYMFNIPSLDVMELGTFGRLHSESQNQSPKTSTQHAETHGV